MSIYLSSQRFAAIALTACLAVAVGTLVLGRIEAGGGPTVRVQPASIQMQYGDGGAQINIRLSDLNHHGQIGYDTDRDGTPDKFQPSNGLGAFEFTIAFDSRIVEVYGGQPGPFLGSTGLSTQCFERTKEPDEYRYGCVTTGSAAAAQGSGLLARVQVDPVANGYSPLAISVEMGGPLADDIPVQAMGGEARVSGAPHTPPTATPSPTPSPTPRGGGNESGNGSGSGNGGGNGGGSGGSGSGVQGAGANGSGNGSGNGGGNGSGGPGDPNFPSAGISYLASAAGRPSLLAGSILVFGFALVSAGLWRSRRSRDAT